MSGRPRRVAPLSQRDRRALRRELSRRRRARAPARWHADPDDVQRSVVHLVLALVEFLRKLMERQAVRRMDEGTLRPEQVEAMGLALMRLERTVRAMARRFGLDPRDLNLELGPLGRLH